MISGGTDMTLETEINEESNFRIHSLTGNFEFDELFEARVGVYDDENFDPDLNSVWDLIDVKSEIMVFRDLESAIQWIS
jgi:hypothetical protein